VRRKRLVEPINLPSSTEGWAARAARRPARLEYWTLKNKIADFPVPIRGRWFSDPRYLGLRNAAWGLRNGRWAGQSEELMLAWVCAEVIALLTAGEPPEAVIPSLVDLFQRP